MAAAVTAAERRLHLGQQPRGCLPSQRGHFPTLLMGSAWPPRPSQQGVGRRPGRRPYCQAAWPLSDVLPPALPPSGNPEGGISIGAHWAREGSRLGRGQEVMLLSI